MASTHVLYNALMVSDVPNFALIVGYTNASWTLKADIVSLHFSKLLNHLRDNKIVKVVPKKELSGDIKIENFDGGLSSGYFNRAGSILPKQGDKYPWKGGVNYILDLLSLTFRGVSMESLEFEVEDKKK